MPNLPELKAQSFVHCSTVQVSFTVEMYMCRTCSTRNVKGVWELLVLPVQILSRESRMERLFSSDTSTPYVFTSFLCRHILNGTLQLKPHPFTF